MSDHVESDLEEILHRLGDTGRMFEGKSFVISGGAGFLARYMVYVFKRLGADRITVLDTLITAGNLGAAFAESVLGDPVIRYVHADVAGYVPIVEPVDYVIHCAALTSPYFYRKYPLETIDAAVDGTRRMLELAREKGARFQFFSSSEMYGDPLVVPTPESYRGNVTTLGVRSCYDESKRLGETLSWIYHSYFGVRVVIVRPHNTYGPGMIEQDYRCMPNFAARLKAGKPLRVYGTGRQTRTFTYITDSVVGFCQALAKGRPAEAYNIGQDSPEVTILELAEMMGQAAQRKPIIEIVPHPDDYPGDEPQRRCPDITKAREHLAFNPVVPLGEGLRRFIQWTEANYKGDSDGR